MTQRTTTRKTARRGFTLVEVVVVMTIMGIMIAIPAPMFLRAVEQSKLDVNSANLRAIWNAERLYRLEHGRYGSISDLLPGGEEDLIDPSIVSATAYYQYSIAVSADGKTFVATAQHPGNSRCYGSISIDENGTLTCEVYYDGAVMVPSLEPQP